MNFPSVCIIPMIHSLFVAMQSDAQNLKSTVFLKCVPPMWPFVLFCAFKVFEYIVYCMGEDQTILHSLTSTIQLFTINKQHRNINKPLKMIVSVHDS